MKNVRRFLIAPSVARLIRRNCGSVRTIEGHFASSAEQRIYVHLDPNKSSLVLTTPMPDGFAFDEAEIPRAHAEALIVSCPGKVVYERSQLKISDGCLCAGAVVRRTGSSRRRAS